MRCNTVVAATALAGALSATVLGLAGPAGAATATHRADARADWKSGAHVAAADESRSWTAARDQLASYGSRYAHERADLSVLVKTPETGTTAAQRAAATRATRELNGFFDTPGLYGVSTGDSKKLARQDWIKSARVSAANRNSWLSAASDQLGARGARYAAQRGELASLASIPLTSTTAKQRATARRDTRKLDSFFNTPSQTT